MSDQEVVQELEAKLENPGGKVTPGRIKRLLMKNGLKFRSITVHQTDTYFDRPDYVLAGTGLSLRVRRYANGKLPKLTAKRVLDNVGGISVREQPECEISPDVDPLALVNGPSGDLEPLRYLADYQTGPFEMTLRVVTCRHIIIVQIGGSTVEISVDAVTFHDLHGKSRRVIDHEIEAELIGRNPEIVRQIVRLLRTQFSTLKPQQADKYRRGLTLFGRMPTKRSLSIRLIRFQEPTADEVAVYLQSIAEPWRPLFAEMLAEVGPSLGRKSQLSMLWNPPGLSHNLIAGEEISRLVGSNPFHLDQSGLLQDGIFVAVNPPRSHFRLFNHTRLQHSLDVSSLSLRLGLHARLGYDLAVNLALAGLLHDEGHPALSHSGEVILMKYCNQDHEERTQQKVRKLAERFSGYGVNVELVLTLLREEGFGQLLSLADTLAYLQRDGQECGFPLPDWIIPTLLENTSFAIDMSLVINPPAAKAIRAMLDHRYLMYKLVYFHPYSQIEELMQQKAIDWAVRTGVLGIDELINGDDPTLLARFAEIAEEYPEVRPLIHGFYPDYCAVRHYVPVATYAIGDLNTPSETDLVESGLNPLDFVLVTPYRQAARKIITGRSLAGRKCHFRTKLNHEVHPYGDKTIVAVRPELVSLLAGMLLARPR